MKDPYQILGVERSSSQEEIKSAFRKQGAKHHPDRNPNDAGAVQRFKEINAAYQILNDPKKRGLYDRFGAAGLGAARAGGDGPFGGMPIDFSDLNIDGIFGDLLDALGIKFGDRGNIQLDLEVDFKEAAFGCTKELNYDRLITCDACLGAGAANDQGRSNCNACSGRGRVRYQQGVFPIAVERRCSRCHGSGTIVTNPCKKCSGVGLRTVTESVSLDIPAGAEAGSSRRLTGKGNMVRNGKPGDLEINVQVRPDAFFRRLGDNVKCTLPVTFVQAVLGDEIEIPTLHGKGLMRVPPGTQPGTVLRIRGKGIPKRVMGGCGDQLVEIQVEIPTELNAHQKECILRLADELGESVQPQRRTFMEKLRDLLS